MVAFQSKAAFSELIHRYQSAVRAYLRHLCSNNATADDLAQDTFIKLWDKAHLFSGTGSFKGWLFKVAYNQFLQGLRKTKSERIKAMSPDETNAVEYQQAKTMSEDFPDLHRFLQVLNPDERKVMVLAYAHGLTHNEISEITDLPLGTIKSHIHRGKLKIQESFNLNEQIPNRQAEGV